MESRNKKAQVKPLESDPLRSDSPWNRRIFAEALAPDRGTGKARLYVETS